jgi:hypothetical protein
MGDQLVAPRRSQDHAKGLKTSATFMGDKIIQRLFDLCPRDPIEIILIPASDR